MAHALLIASLIGVHGASGLASAGEREGRPTERVEAQQVLLTQAMKEEQTLLLTSAKLTFHSVTSNPIRMSELEIRAPDGTNAVAGQTAVDFQDTGGEGEDTIYRYFDGDLNWQPPFTSWHSFAADTHFVVQFTTPIQSVSNVSVVQSGISGERNQQWSIHIYASDGSEALHGTFDHGAESGGPSMRQTVEFAAPATNPAPPTGAGAGAPPTGAGAGASAVGDPHLQNIHGERFDLMKAGKHVLINIPRGMSAENALLRVQADARWLGGQCADMYFQKINVTGSWAEAKQTGGYHYSVSERDIKAPEWVAFGKVELKVVHGRTDSGLLYLNLYVKHLGRAGFAIGGLLGEDDHEDVSVAPESCAQRLDLVAGTHRDEGQALSFAVASLA